MGVLLVAGSVVAGARLLAAADDTVAVWAMAADRGAGTPLRADDLVVERVRFNRAGAQERYFAADEPVPADLVLTHAVGAGELLARAAVGPDDATPVLRVPLEADPHRVPPAVAEGSVVDVWVSDGAERGTTRAADEPALSAVTVVAAPAADDGAFTLTGARQLVVAVDEARATAFERLLGGLQYPVIRILQRS